MKLPWLLWKLLRSSWKRKEEINKHKNVQNFNCLPIYLVTKINLLMSQTVLQAGLDTPI